MLNINATGEEMGFGVRKVLYSLTVRNGSDVASSFHPSAECVIEMGTRVEIYGG